MRNITNVFLAIGLVGGFWMSPLRADNFLTNIDFKDGLQGWHGDADRAFLKKDGTEGAEGDPEVIPVIKLKLSRGSSHSVYQEFSTPSQPTALHVSVEVMASADFARSKYASDYSIDWKPGGIWYWSAVAIPNVDFWIRGGGSSWFYKLATLRPGAWTTVEAGVEGLPGDRDRTINYCVPPGTGAVYLRHPFVGP